MSQGWIKLHRKIQTSEMYLNLNSKQRDVMMQCLLLANHDGKKWFWGKEIYECKPGQFITSLESLTKLCGKDVKTQSVRTSLLILEKWHFLTNESTKTGRLITIINWGTYQNDDADTNKDTNKELTKSQQRANKELTTNKNVKNEKKIIKENKAKEKNKYIDKIDVCYKHYESVYKINANIPFLRLRQLLIKWFDNNYSEHDICAVIDYCKKLYDKASAFDKEKYMSCNFFLSEKVFEQYLMQAKSEAEENKSKSLVDKYKEKGGIIGFE